MKRKQDFALGLTVLVLVGLLVGSVFFIAGSPFFRPQTAPLEVHFTLEEGMAPLKAGGPVLLRGAIQVGEITSVEIEPRGDDPNLRQPVIIVQARIRADVQLYADCLITTNQPVIGGGGYLVIQDVGDPAAGPVTAAYVNGRRPQSLQAAIEGLSEWLLGRGGFLEKLDAMIDPETEGSIMHKVASMLDDVNAITASLERQMTPADRTALLGKVHAIADHVAAATAAIRAETERSADDAMLARVHVLLDRLDEGLVAARDMLQENRPPLRSALQSVAASAAVVEEELLPAVAAEFDRDDAAALLGKIHGSLDALRASLDNVRATTETGKRMLTVNRPAIDRVVANIKEASEQMKAGMAEIRLQPWRIVSPPTQQEQEKIAAFEAARLFAEAARRLDDAAARLAALAEAAPAEQRSVDDQEELESLEQSLRSAFEKFHEAEQYLWDQVK